MLKESRVETNLTHAEKRAVEKNFIVDGIINPNNKASLITHLLKGNIDLGHG